MFPKTIEFEVVERKNTFTKLGKEWAFNVKFDNDNWWTVTTFSKKPKRGQITDLMVIINRTLQIYHGSIKIPPLNLSDNTSWDMLESLEL